MIFGHVTRAFSASALALSLTGCVVSPQGLTQQYGYGCGSVIVHGGRRSFVVPRPCYNNYGGYAAPAPYYAPAYVGASPYAQPSQPTPQTYSAQPAAVAQPAANPPAAVDPPPLIPVDPPGMYRVDKSCSSWWAICHFF